MNAPYFKATEEPERICLILITEIIAYRKHRAALQCLNKHHNGQDYQGRKEGGLLKENMVLSAEFGVAPSVALLPAGRFAVPRGPRSGAAGQSQRRSRRSRSFSPW